MSKAINDVIRSEIEKFQVKEVEVKMDNSQGNTFKVVMTSEVEDRDGEIVKIQGMESQPFEENPVVLINHDYKVENIVGKVLNVYVEGDNIIAEGEFASGTEKSDIARELYNGGFLKAVSIGFMVKERDASDRSIITAWELLELSFVAVQSNRLALSLDGKMHKKAIEEGISFEKSAEKKEITVDKTIEQMLTEELKDSGLERCYVMQLFIGYFVYVQYSDEYNDGKYFKQSYSIDTNSVSITGEAEEVERISAWQEKGFDIHSMKSNISEIHDSVKSIADSLKNFAEDKAEVDVRKQAQELVKGVSAYLEKTKKSK